MSHWIIVPVVLPAIVAPFIVAAARHDIVLQHGAFHQPLDERRRCDTQYGRHEPARLLRWSDDERLVFPCRLRHCQ